MQAVKQMMVMAVVSVALLSQLPAQAGGVPVIDPMAIAQAKLQVDQLREQVKAITDNGNFASLLKDPNLRKQFNKYLPQGYTDVMQAVQQGDASALQNIYKQVLAEEKRKQKTMTGAERVKMTQAAAEAQMIGMMRTLDVRSQSVSNLIDQINRTGNMAQKQDLMNTLQAEQAQISLDMNRMQVLIKMTERQEKMAERQAVEEYRKSTNR